MDWRIRIEDGRENRRGKDDNIMGFKVGSRGD